MPLIVPLSPYKDATERNLLALAESLGIECVQEPLKQIFASSSGNESAPANSCLVLNPQQLKRTLGDSILSHDTAARLCSQFRFLMICNLSLDPYCDQLVKILSGGLLRSVEMARTNRPYEVPAGDDGVCGPFSGLAFGTAGAGDFVLQADPQRPLPALTSITSIDGRPHMARMRRGNAELFFLAASEIADIHAPASIKQPVGEFFSTLIEPAMLLRYMFPEQFWHQKEHYAALIVDDPPLWPDYGYLNYERLVGLMDQHGFHTCTAFIPHNYRRSAAETAKLFSRRRDRLSLCFHGNDHTGAEFGEHNPAKLNQILKSAISRMDQHRAGTSLDCDRVMVFPQGIFSREAMAALRRNNFLAAINTEDHPAGATDHIELGDLLQPAVLKYGFPLFLRKPVERINPEDIAFNLFFSKPIFIGAHHDSFKQVETLEGLVERINSLCPAIRWSSPATAINGSYVTRRSAAGVREIRTYSNEGSLENQSECAVRFSLDLTGGLPLEQRRLLLNGQCDLNSIVEPGDSRISLSLAPGKRCSFDVSHDDPATTSRELHIGAAIASFCRRRLSEFRDNYLSKSPGMLLTAKTLQRRMQGLLNP